MNLVPYVGPFLLGFLGSASVDLVTCFHFYQSESPFPARYHKKGFWAVRLLIAAAAGGLVLAYSIKDNPILAINIGASAPAILLTLAEGVKQGPPDSVRFFLPLDMRQEKEMPHPVVHFDLRSAAKIRQEWNIRRPRPLFPC